jgi:putative two-component system response regulator
MHKRLSTRNDDLEALVRQRTMALEDAQDEIVNRLAMAGEFRDEDTGGHTVRVGEMAARIAAVLGLAGQQVRLIYLAARLHDIGKIGISDSILLKPGTLGADEIAAMRRHTELGGRMLANGRTPLLQMAERIALTHHERFDGSGYPMRLVGEAIPIEGRIVAVADVFDALTNDRPYKQAWESDAAIREITALAGSQFDPRVVEAFLVVMGDRGSLAA